MSPAVTVVIPAYNMGQFLGQTLESLAAQTFTDWEAVLVDDGSTDDTWQVFESFSELPIRALRQENKGVAAARNKAIESSDSEFVAFLDADDVLLPDSLEARVSALRAHPDAGMVYGRSLIVDGHGKHIGARGKRIREDILRIPPEQAVPRLLERNTITTSTVMARRVCLESAGGFNEDMKASGEDWHLFLRICAQHPLLYLPKFLAKYRTHPSNTTSISGGSARDLEDRLVALESFFAPESPGWAFRQHRSRALAAQYARSAQSAVARRQRRVGIGYFARAVKHRPSRMLSDDSAFLIYMLAKSLLPAKALVTARRARYWAANAALGRVRQA
ncbi:MAG: glycosyltransferase [Chloroflexota bacterium]